MKKVRKKARNTNKLTQRDIDILFNSLIVFSGTGFKETQLSVARSFKRECLASPFKKSETYYQQLLTISRKRLMKVENWNVLTIAILDDGDKVKTKEQFNLVHGKKADSDEMTDALMSFKVELVKSINPMYLIGVYTVFLPSAEEKYSEMDDLVDQLLILLDHYGLLDKKAIREVFDERTPPDYLEMLKEASRYECLGTAIKSSITGFDH